MGHVGRQRYSARVRRAAIGDDGNDLGDHITGATHDHGVADADVFALHLVHVVQRGVADGDSADEHGFQTSYGRQRPGPAHLKLHAAHDRQLFLRGKLVSDRPPRSPGHEAELALPVEPVDLVHDAIDVVRQRGTLSADSGVVFEATGNAVHERGFRANAKAERAQHLDDRALLFDAPQSFVADFAERVEKCIQRP